MINVIDSIPGSGKTTAMINYIKSNPDRKYIYITPVLTEAEGRIPYACVTKMPQVYFSTPRINSAVRTKLDAMRILVNKGLNISTTHSLFGSFDRDIVEKIIEKQYVLIIDEAIDCMSILSDKYNRADHFALLQGEFITVDEKDRGRVSWIEEKYPKHDGQYGEIRNVCRTKSLYMFMDTLMISEYPPDLMLGLKDIFVLTYMFESSDMCMWLKLNEIPYNYTSLEDVGIDQGYILEAVRANLRTLSTNALDKLISKQKSSDLSLNWYSVTKRMHVKEYTRLVESLLAYNRIKRGQMYWTCFKDYKDLLKGKGFTQDFTNGDACFIPKNIKAINTYRNCTVAMNTCNVYRHPSLHRYLYKYGVKPDGDAMALSELIQFVFRGAIREGNPQQVIILSRRMKDIFEKWLKNI